jgi:hypothetical protein
VARAIVFYHFTAIDNFSRFEVMDIFDKSLTIDEPADCIRMSRTKFYGMALAVGKRELKA